MAQTPVDQARPRGSLRTTVLRAFLALTLIPLILLSTVMIWRQSEDSRAQIVDRLTSHAILKEAEVKTWFNSLWPNLQMVTADPRVRADMASVLSAPESPARHTLLQTLLDAQKNGTNFTEIFLMDASGTVVISTNPGRTGQVLDRQPFFLQGIHQPYVQSPFYSLVYDTMVVMAAIPVQGAGDQAGVLVGVSTLDTLNQVMSEHTGLGQTGETYLVSSDYVMLTRPRKPDTAGFPAVRTVGSKAALAGQNGSGLYKNYRYPAETVVGVYRWIPQLHVALLAEQSATEAFAGPRQNAWLMLWMALLVAIVTIVASFVVTRSLITPIEHLTSVATRMAHRRLAEPVLIKRDDEIGALAAAFNAMTVQLRDLIEGLEDRVAERTAAMEAQREELHRFEQRLALHVQSTPLAAIELDVEQRVSAWNASAERIFGYASGEALGRPALDLLVPPKARQHMSAVWADLLANQGGLHHTSENVTRSGQTIICEWYNTTLVDQNGQVIGVASLVQDITDRVMADEALRASEDRYRRLFSEMLDGFALHEVIWNNAGKPVDYVFREVNPAFEALTGLPARDLLGQPARQVLPHLEPAWFDLYDHVAVTREPVHYESYLSTLDKHVQLTAYSPQKGQCAIIMEDITKRKRADDATQQSNRELALLNAQLQTRNEELDAFAHTVAHDLKNPLGTVMGYIEVMVAYGPTMTPEEWRGALQAAARSTRKMDNIIDELLLLSEVRKVEVRCEQLDMGSIVAEALLRLADMIDGRAARVILPQAWPAAVGYAPWIEEVWINYISNAVKYSGHPPCLELGAEELPNHQARFWVHDNGQGIEPQDQERLFTPFTRLNGVRAQGHGLGLSIVRRIVEKLGGQVGVESLPGQGSRFYFTLAAAGSPPSLPPPPA